MQGKRPFGEIPKTKKTKKKKQKKKNKGLSFYCQGLPDYKACEVVELKNNLENSKNDEIVFPTCHLL